MDYKKYITTRCAMVEEQLSHLVPELSTPEKVLFQAARYSLLNGGKRLRPILALATAESLGGDLKKALTPACALEMIHTYSLIHDDLPCMDDDDYRRGKPSLHKAYPEGLAVLAGDFLLTHAFEVLTHSEQLTADQKLRLVQILSKQAGGLGMIGGQILDIESEGKKINLEQLRLIHHKKTGALITASIQFGGIMANASDREMHLLEQFGKEIGLAFQIIDDVLDVTASEKKHGKKVASDVTNNKSTYVTLLGLEQSEAMAHSLLNKAKDILKQFDHDVSLLQHLAEIIVTRNG